MVVWSEIETVFLDMDGTLLDLRFDNYFWQEHVPLRYAESKGLDFKAACEEVAARCKAVEGTLQWYCLDYWSDELGLDIPLLKEEVDHLIAVHPHVVDFLETVRAHGHRIVLVTNAHGRSLDLKMSKTSLGHHFDAICCSHDLGCPKENPEFWGLLQQHEPFDPDRTLLVDDSLPVLRSARAFGIRHLLAVRKPDTTEPERDIRGFDAIEHFREILPGNV